MPAFFKDVKEFVSDSVDSYRRNQTVTKAHKELVEFNIQSLRHSEQLTSLFNHEENLAFNDFLKTAKDFVSQFTKHYIQEDIFHEHKLGVLGLTLTLSSPGFDGFFIVRIPVELVENDTSGVFHHRVLRNRTYTVEYCKNGFKEKDPVIAGSFNF